jgi:hypothetical protein
MSENAGILSEFAGMCGYANSSGAATLHPMVAPFLLIRRAPLSCAKRAALTTPGTSPGTEPSLSEKLAGVLVDRCVDLSVKIADRQTELLRASAPDQS